MNQVGQAIAEESLDQTEIICHHIFEGIKDFAKTSQDDQDCSVESTMGIASGRYRRESKCFFRMWYYIRISATQMQVISSPQYDRTSVICSHLNRFAVETNGDDTPKCCRRVIGTIPRGYLKTNPIQLEAPLANWKTYMLLWIR